jgi:hypothetical protein
MATATSLPPSTVQPSTPSLYRMSYELYERMVEHGLLGKRDKVVLLDGLLVNRRTKTPPYSTTVGRGDAILRVSIPVGWHVRTQNPVVLREGPNGDSAPEPPLIVLYGNIQRYETRHPIGSDVGLVIEVATDTDAVRIDRAGMARYAHAGIPIACIVNIPDRSIELYTDPTGPIDDPRYRALATLRPGQSLGGEIGNATTGPAMLAPIPVESFFAPN